MRHDEGAEGEERRGDLEHRLVAGALEVALPEAAEEPLEGALEAAAPLQREKDVVEAQAADVVGRLAPFAARAVEHAEIRPGAKEDVPGMEVAVHLAEPRGARAQLPAPGEHAPLDLLQGRERDRPLVGIAVVHAEDALAVAEKLAHAPAIKVRRGQLLAMDVHQVAAERIGARKVVRAELAR